jgi:hypothetical protein
MRRTMIAEKEAPRAASRAAPWPALNEDVARPEHDQHAQQSHQHGDPPAQAHGLAQDRHRERGDQQWRGEQQGVGLGQGQHGKGIEGGGHGDHHGQGPGRHQPGVTGPQIGQRLIGRQHAGDRHEGEEHAEEDDLEHRIARAQGLDDGVVGGERAECQHGQPGAAGKAAHCKTLGFHGIFLIAVGVSGVWPPAAMAEVGVLADRCQLEWARWSGMTTAYIAMHNHDYRMRRRESGRRP